MRNSERIPSDDSLNGPATPYSVDLLFPQQPTLNTDAVADRVRAFCPQVDVTHAGGRPPILFSHKDHLVPIKLTDSGTASVPSRTVVMPTERVTDVSSLHAALGQTRDWDEAVEALARSTARMVVTDMLAGDLPARERLAVFEAVLLGVIEAVRPTAIHWKPAGKLVNPLALLRASGSAEVDALPSAAINVRMFRVKRAADGLLMDTLGLSALGLPDFQVAFHSMDPARVAGHLYAIALYTLRNGGLVDPGESIDGPAEGQEWVARYSHSLAEPTRSVVDFDPGSNYSIRAA